MGTLFLVATPIGNLGDITYRAVQLLSQVKLIAAEDTRHTRKLLNHYGIHTRMLSYYEHNKLSRGEEILTALESGDVALVSDAGTPALNDPGYELVQLAIRRGIPISPVPGPNAPLTGLIASGLPTDSFLYLGYLPRKVNQRRRLIQQIANLPYTLVFLEAPHRLIGGLQSLLTGLGDREMTVARELTKIHEEFFRGKISVTLAYFSEHTPRGELVLIIAGCFDDEVWTEERLSFEIQKRIADDSPASQIADEIASLSGCTPRVVYRRINQLKSQREIRN